MATIAEIAWAAGFFEGEGCITLTEDRPVLRVNGTDRETVEFFGRVIGVGKVYGPYQAKRDSHGCVRKPFWVWVCYGLGARRALTLLSPWLSRRRLNRIRELYGETGVLASNSGGRRLRAVLARSPSET